MPGPPPKHPDQRRRRNATVPLLQLPAQGRRGAPPAWPLRDPTVLEDEVWVEVWATPQAAVWERLGWTRAVARYVRRLIEAESAEAPMAVNAEVRQMEDRLGLTPMAMMRLRWEVAADEVAEARSTRESARSRLKVVDPTLAAER